MNINYNNYFSLIGKCISVNNELMVLLVDSNVVNLFFSEDYDTNCIEINKITKVEGYIDFTNVIPKLTICKVYQLKDEYVM